MNGRKAQRSDRIGRCKGLAVLGYGLAALTKTIFPLAPSVGWRVVARFIDRIGKGICGAPFDLRQAFATVGALLGSLLVIALMWAFADDFSSVFWVAVIPTVGALALILFLVHEPERPEGLRRVRNPLAWLRWRPPSRSPGSARQS